MKILFVGICMLIAIQFGFAQGRLIGPQMQMPDSIAGNFTGGIYLDCHVTGDGKIMGWNITSIVPWGRKGKAGNTIYRENIKWYYRNAQTGQYESKIVGNLKFKNSSYGIALAKKFTPWLEEYVKKTRFQILDSAAMQRITWDGNMRQTAVPFSMTIEVWGKKKIKERHQ